MGTRSPRVSNFLSPNVSIPFGALPDTTDRRWCFIPRKTGGLVYPQSEVACHLYSSAERMAIIFSICMSCIV